MPRPAALVALLPPALFVVAACGGSSSVAPNPVTASPTAAASGTPDPGPPKTCDCSLCEPKISEDPCSTDADCAPSTPCHAPACVAKVKAEPRKPDTMCTMDMRCDTADANDCKCMAGRCALVGRKR